MKTLQVVATVLSFVAAGIVQIACAEQTASGPCASPPIVELAFAPAFPDLPWKARIGADQWVEVEINALGDVADATTEAEKNPSLRFGDAALTAARRWKFVAAPDCELRKSRLLFRFVMPVTKARAVGVQFRPPYEIDVSVQALSINLDHND